MNKIIFLILCLTLPANSKVSTWDGTQTVNKFFLDVGYSGYYGGKYEIPEWLSLLSKNCQDAADNWDQTEVAKTDAKLLMQYSDCIKHCSDFYYNRGKTEKSCLCYIEFDWQDFYTTQDFEDACDEISGKVCIKDVVIKNSLGAKAITKNYDIICLPSGCANKKDYSIIHEEY